MTQLHPDSTAINALGTRRLTEHFQIGRQAVFYWRRSGIPKQYRRPLVLLAKEAGVDLGDFSATDGTVDASKHAG